MFSEIKFPLDNRQLHALQIESQLQKTQILNLVPQIVDAYLETMTDMMAEAAHDPSG